MQWKLLKKRFQSAFAKKIAVSLASTEEWSLIQFTTFSSPWWTITCTEKGAGK